ncbi:MAG: hypothetical protein KAS90_00960 [Candidatus Aenigmarchaeota archaeon]|nr:hypothetical protein [Candidatus Aenigmarchaeota archaeon]
MGIFDFLKGIIPEKLINIDLRKTDNRKIIINSNSVIIGENKITDPKIVDKIFNKIGEYEDSESLPVQIVHKDLEDSYFEYEDLSIEQNTNIKKLKEILPIEDIRCIIMARRVKRAYDKKSPEAKNLHNKLNSNYPEKGCRVFNLIGGGYFDEMLIPFIEIFKSEHEDNYVEKYRDFFNNTIHFFSLAIFVGNSKTEETIEKELNTRLQLKDIPFVRIHAIGKNNIEKIENVIEKLDIENIYSTKDNKFTAPSGLKAQILEIRMKEKKKDK